MNEASFWRHALAQQIAPHYSTNPKVRAVSLEGSVAQGCADRYSSIDLAVFWSAALTQKERRDILNRAGGRRGQLLPYNREAGCWVDDYEVGGVSIRVRHTTIETTERMLADVLALIPRWPNSSTWPHSSLPCPSPNPQYSPTGSSKRWSTHMN